MICRESIRESHELFFFFFKVPSFLSLTDNKNKGMQIMRKILFLYRMFFFPIREQ